MLERCKYTLKFVNSFKADADQPYKGYFELLGECDPLIDLKGMNATTRYEYCWTLGLTESDDQASDGAPAPGQEGISQESRILDFLHGPKSKDPLKPDLRWGHHLSDPAADIYVLFPIYEGWRVQELIATVKYLLPPPPQHAAWLDQVDHLLQSTQPLVNSIGSLMQTAGGVTAQPEISAAGAMLSAIAKARINNVPTAKDGGYDWFVAKESFLKNDNALEGIKWRIPKQMLIELGGRLTGSVSVSFLQAKTQEPKQNMGMYHGICARAVIYTGPPKDQKLWIPGEDKLYLELNVVPRVC